MDDQPTTPVHDGEQECFDEFGEPLDGEWRTCIDGMVWGPCEYEKCGGVCVRHFDCECPCHGGAAT